MINEKIRRHERSYLGKHYRVRIAAYLVLFDLMNSGDAKGLTPTELYHEAALPSINYARRQAPVWAKWHDLSRKTGRDKRNYPTSYYQIAESGIKFLQSIPSEIIQEIRNRIEDDKKKRIST